MSMSVEMTNTLGLIIKYYTYTIGNMTTDYKLLVNSLSFCKN